MGHRQTYPLKMVGLPIHGANLHSIHRNREVASIETPGSVVLHVHKVNNTKQSGQRPIGACTPCLPAINAIT